jgi:hypothetical protein
MRAISMQILGNIPSALNPEHGYLSGYHKNEAE